MEIDKELLVTDWERSDQSSIFSALEFYTKKGIEYSIK